MAGRDTGNAPAISPAWRLPERSRSRSARRVGSARAWKTVAVEYVTDMFRITCYHTVTQSSCQALCEDGKLAAFGLGLGRATNVLRQWVRLGEFEARTRSRLWPCYSWSLSGSKMPRSSASGSEAKVECCQRGSPTMRVG